jgi:nucleoside 2-deoxyribosyltransferase
MADAHERIKAIQEFKAALQEWHRGHDPKLRAWLNQNVPSIHRETIEANTHDIMTIYPPPVVGGPPMRVDPFDHMFEPIYFKSMVPYIEDMLDRTIGILRHPQPSIEADASAQVETEVKSGYAFVAMPMDENNHQLVDVLEAIKVGAKECGITAERIDDEERNERITDRMLEAIRKAEFVIVDLTNERPNVFYEAGYARGLGKIPIYIASAGTYLHFDVKDYPVITFRNMKELREGIVRRLRAIARPRPERALRSAAKQMTIRNDDKLSARYSV